MKRRWTREEDEFLLVSIEAKKQEETITDITRELAGTLGRTPSSIRVRYYNLINKKKEEPPQVEIEIEAELAERLARLEREALTVERLPLALAEMGLEKDKRVRELEGVVREQAKIIQELEDCVNIFTNMATVSQIMSLGDFKTQMKVVLDKWDRVQDLKVERVCCHKDPS